MHKILATFLLLGPAIATAGEQQPRVLRESIEPVGYVAEVRGDVLVPGVAWQGEKIVQLEDGTCQRITHTDLTLKKIGSVQAPTFKEQKTSINCREVFTSARYDDSQRIEAQLVQLNATNLQIVALLSKLAANQDATGQQK